MILKWQFFMLKKDTLNNKVCRFFNQTLLFIYLVLLLLLSLLPGPVSIIKQQDLIMVYQPCRALLLFSWITPFKGSIKKVCMSNWGNHLLIFKYQWMYGSYEVTLGIYSEQRYLLCDRRGQFSSYWNIISKKKDVL